jgi:hypothetical protein
MEHVFHAPGLGIAGYDDVRRWFQAGDDGCASTKKDGLKMLTTKEIDTIIGLVKELRELTQSDGTHKQCAITLARLEKESAAAEIYDFLIRKSAEINSLRKSACDGGIKSGPINLTISGGSWTQEKK